MLESVFSEYSCFGFSGSRRYPDRVPLELAAAAVPVDAAVVVGCARGVDEFFRGRFPAALVHRADASQGKKAFVTRSVACVDAVGIQQGLWVSFPAAACPPGLMPSSRVFQCFNGSGSGTWASLAYAIGCGIPSIVYLGSVSAPVGWGLVPLPGLVDWWQFRPQSEQLSLM